MRPFFRTALPFLFLAIAVVPGARAVSCTVAAAMTGDQRAALFNAAHELGGDVLRGDVTALKADTIPSVASDFSGIAGTVTTVAPELQGATLTVNNLYLLNALDLTGSQDDVQFFCSVTGAQLLVTVTLGQLPKGEYALALLHATGVKAPQQFAMVLEDMGTPAAPKWELAGFFSRPMTVDGHDSEWFWAQARDLKAKNAPFSAYFYYETADYLARPADLFTSNNLEKLGRETASVQPTTLPGNSPMQLTTGTQTFAVTGLRADATLGSLDLRVDVQAQSVADPVAARKDAIALMEALLQQHPDLRTSFRGLWVYQTTATGQTFAVEQPMTALP